MTPFGIDHSGVGGMPEGGSDPEPTYLIWHVGQSRFNGRDGQALFVACMRNTRTGKDSPVLYSKAYGLDSLCHAHAARLIDRPAGWVPPGGILAPGAEG